MAERWSRGIYAAEVILLGLPTLAISIPLLLLGVVALVAAAGQAFEWTALVVLAMVLAGASGLAGGCVLSGHFLIDGRRGLREADGVWWLALAAGMAAGAVMCLPLIDDGWQGMRRARLPWFMGPAMLVPAFHLIWLRLTRVTGVPAESS
jgi:hypothetical protein